MDEKYWNERNKQVLKEKQEAIDRANAFKSLSKPKFVERHWLGIMLLSGCVNSLLGFLGTEYSSQLREKKQSKVDTVYVVNQTKTQVIYIDTLKPPKNK